MIFIIKTNDEVAGLDIHEALSLAGIQITILSKQHDEVFQKNIQTACPKCGNTGKPITDIGGNKSCPVCGGSGSYDTMETVEPCPVCKTGKRG